jgi:hypothetical protein
MRYAITWLALAAVIAVGIGSLNWATYYRMVAVGVSGQASVVELLPNVHNTVRYEYRVGGEAFNGQMQSWQPNLPLEQLKVGQPLVIYYDPQHPAKSVLGNPKPMLQNETISVALAAIGVPSFIVAGWAWRSSRRNAHQ